MAHTPSFGGAGNSVHEPEASGLPDLASKGQSNYYNIIIKAEKKKRKKENNYFILFYFWARRGSFFGSLQPYPEWI